MTATAILASVATKVCTKCGETKPLSAYWALAASKDGRAWYCKQCSSSASANWRKANKETLKISKAEHHAAKKDHYNAKSKEWYRANLEYARGKLKEYRDAHVEELRAYSVEWRKNNLEKSRSGVAEYQAKHPEMRKASRQNRRAKIKQADGVITKSVVLKLLKLQRGKCAVCKCEASGNYHIDHIYPLSKGGSNVIENLQLLCPACNLSKSAKHPIDFMQSKGFLL